jgi:hypothetical protein
VTKLVRHDATLLAKELAHNLFCSVGNCPDYKCPNTGMIIESCTEYMVAHDMNRNAMGAHYEAFGYFYILCFDQDNYEEYVAIHTADGAMVGTMFEADEVQVIRYGQKAHD